ncbi:hypothetical protein RvY_01692-2 [Ramazzottius varieornatus]|nr:hypothetical protein RvY_01692-2 [Ramazzottius varieornatus]
MPTPANGSARSHGPDRSSFATSSTKSASGSARSNTGSIRAYHTPLHATSSAPVESRFTRDARGDRNATRDGKLRQQGSIKSNSSAWDALLSLQELDRKRRPVMMAARPPASFSRLATYHAVSSVVTISCQITVTVLVSVCSEETHLFQHHTPGPYNVGKASLGIVAGVIYYLLATYGWYMARNIYSFASDVLKDKLWLFNVLNGLSVIVSLLLFGASSYLSKSSACWYDEIPGSASASALLAMSLFLTITACFEICIGATGVFVK